MDASSRTSRKNSSPGVSIDSGSGISPSQFRSPTGTVHSRSTSTTMASARDFPESSLTLPGGNAMTRYNGPVTNYSQGRGYTPDYVHHQGAGRTQTTGSNHPYAPSIGGSIDPIIARAIANRIETSTINIHMANHTGRHVGNHVEIVEGAATHIPARENATCITHSETNIGHIGHRIRVMERRNR